MKSLKVLAIVALGSVLFTSCSTKYGCPYNTLNETEIKTVPVEKAVPAQRSTDVYNTVAVAR